MAGHSKWSKIKRKKGAKDVARSTRFSKATRAIRGASRACSGNLDDLHLQNTIAAAKDMQVPKDQIVKAIESGNKTKNGDGMKMETIRYDGRVMVEGSKKIAIIVMALTENRNRTAAHLRAAITRAGGELLSTGDNEFLFDHVGLVFAEKKKTRDGDEEAPFGGVTEEEEEELLECALEGGATDADFGSSDDRHVLIKCEPIDLHPLVVALRDGGYRPTEFESRYLFKDENNLVTLDATSTASLELFLTKMEEDEDITAVFHSANLMNEDE